MIGPRHPGSSPTLKRQLSRLSSSSSFQVRQSNSRIYTILVAGGLLLLATVALLQVLLQGAPHGSKLSPREQGKPGEGIVPEQSWWSKGDGGGAAEKSKLGRRLGPVQVIEDSDEDEDVDVVDEMDDEEDEEPDQQALFDIDVDDRLAEEEEPEGEDLELEPLPKTANDEEGGGAAEDSVNEAVRKSGEKFSADEPGGDSVASSTSRALGPGNERSIPADQDTKEVVAEESQHGDGMVRVHAIPAWVLDMKLGGLEEGGASSLRRDLAKGLEVKKKGPFFSLGARKSALEKVEPSRAEGDVEFGGVTSKVAMQHLKGFTDFVESWKERFNSDDELVDDTVQQRLEGVREIEDALLLNGGEIPASKTLHAVLKKGPRGSFDRFNPSSNPMLQDPDTPPGTWMTKTDREILRAMRGGQQQQQQQPPQGMLRGNILAVGASEVRRQASSR